MSPAGKKREAAIEKSVKEAETRRIREKRFTRPSKDERDDFYRWFNHKNRELNNCPKTLEEQLQYTRDTCPPCLTNSKQKKEISFPEPSTECRLEMVGNYGVSTPQRGRKRASC